MRLLFMVLLMTQLCGNSYSQPIDTVQRHIDSINRSLQSLEDSLYRLRMLRNIDEKGQTLDQFLADFKKREEKERRQTYIKIGAGAILMAGILYGILRKRRLEKKR